MSIFTIIQTIVLCLASFILFIFTCSLLLNITEYFSAKTSNIIKQTESEIFNASLTRANTLKVESETLGTLLLAIDNLIIAEISTIFKTYVGLGQKYEYIKMEDDIKTVATEVFNALRKEYLFSNDHTIITDEYIMRYIQNQTMIFFIRTIQEFNLYVKFN